MRKRDAKKQASRARVIGAARDLFEEMGFQETTVRMLAERAGLSPGGVFTTFDDKVAILCHILGEHRARLFDEMEALRPHLHGTVRERLAALMRLVNSQEFARRRLVLAYAGASYTWSPQLEEEHLKLHRRLAGVLGEVVRDGVANGEVRSDLEPDLLVELIWAGYQSAARAAYHAGLGEDALNGWTERQLDLLFQGVRPN